MRAGRRQAPAAAPRAEQNRDGLGGTTGIVPAAARAFGIQEPPADLPAADPAGYAAALALVPCLAASRDGVRLGRGGGYYDRFLAYYKGAGLLLCPEALLLDELPCDDWDARFAPENILTEKGILR